MDILYTLVRKGLRKGVLLTRNDEFDLNDVQDLEVCETDFGFLVTKERIDCDIEDKDVAYYLDMLYREGEEYFSSFKDRVSLSVLTTDGEELHAEVHDIDFVTKSELIRHAISMTERWNSGLKGIEVYYEIREIPGINSRINAVRMKDRRFIMSNFNQYVDDIWNTLYLDEGEVVEDHPAYEALIRMDLDQFEREYTDVVKCFD